MFDLSFTFHLHSPGDRDCAKAGLTFWFTCLSRWLWLCKSCANVFLRAHSGDRDCAKAGLTFWFTCLSRWLWRCKSWANFFFYVPIQVIRRCRSWVNFFFGFPRPFMRPLYFLSLPSSLSIYWRWVRFHSSFSKFDHQSKLCLICRLRFTCRLQVIVTVQ